MFLHAHGAIKQVLVNSIGVIQKSNGEIRKMSPIRRLIVWIATVVALLMVLFSTLYGGFYAWGLAKTIRFASDQLLLAAAQFKQSGSSSDLLSTLKLDELLSTQNLDVIAQVSYWSEPKLWFAIGASVGFVFSSVAAGIIMILGEIAYNTRRTLSYFERIDARAQSRQEE